MEGYIPIFEIMIDEDSEDSGMIRNSWVENPAVEVDYFAFSKDKKMVFAHPDRNNCFMSVSILCDTPILREGPNGELFYVVFTKDVIRKINNKLFKDNKIHEVTMYHEDDKPVEGVYLVESFISDRERVYSPLFDVPDGSLIQTYYVEDDAQYQQLLEDDAFNGYSIEINARIQQMFSTDFNEAVVEAKVKKIAFDETMTEKEREEAIKKLLNL